MSLDLFKIRFSYFKDFNYKNNFNKDIPFWVPNVAYSNNSLKFKNFFRNNLFSIRILNYYWNDLMSHNSKIMAKCASLININNVSFK